MQPALESTSHRERTAQAAPGPVGGTDHPELQVEAGVPEGFRRLRWNEVVCLGDFVMDAHHGFQLWDGPRGFRADAFVKPTYRSDRTVSAKRHS